MNNYSRVLYRDVLSQIDRYLHKDERGPSLLEDILQSGKRDLYSKI